MVFTILAKCCANDEKLVIFVNSLSSMYALQHFLQLLNRNPRGMPHELAGQWVCGKDYFLLFGETSVETRESFIDTFNDEKNKQARFVYEAVNILQCLKILHYSFY